MHDLGPYWRDSSLWQQEMPVVLPNIPFRQRHFIICLAFLVPCAAYQSSWGWWWELSRFSISGFSRRVLTFSQSTIRAWSLKKSLQLLLSLLIWSAMGLLHKMWGSSVTAFRYHMANEFYWMWRNQWRRPAYPWVPWRPWSLFLKFLTLSHFLIRCSFSPHIVHLRTGHSLQKCLFLQM